jgi:hypothetical protein
VGTTGLLVIVQGYGWNVLFAWIYAIGMIALILALRFGLKVEGSADEANGHG